MTSNREETLRIAEDAARWLYRLREEDAADCRAEFAAWLEESPKHMREMLMMTAVSREFDAVDAAREIDIKAMLAGTAENLLALPASPRSTSKSTATSRIDRSRPSRWRPAIAASALLVSGAGFTAWLLMASGTFSTTIGEQRTVKLDDGSIMYLNTRSRARVDYSAAARNIRLERGEALFVVSREARRPFIVMAGELTVRAVGTQFNVIMHENATTVSVVEGKVQVSTPADPTKSLATAGEQVRIARDGTVVQHPAPATSEPIAWRQRRLVFRDDTLADIVEEFNRYNRHPQFHVTEPAVRERRYTGTFDADDPRSLEELLKRESDLALERRDDEVLIRERKN